ncbi:MAG: methyltransferase domain-containing protein [Kiloniellales bacterium]|nr:methyltransferase domain-containing protein [Kiloniellales bacterium]
MDDKTGTKQSKDYVAANRAAWDEVAPIHARHNQDHQLAAFRRPGYSCLEPVETELLRAIGIEGKDVAQLCCNNGREILSVKNLGAGRCVGFDFSARFLEQAQALAAAAGIACDFVETEVTEVAPDYDGAFDLVLITIGVLNWMPDLEAFFAVPARLLRPGGLVLLHEQHPALNMFEPGDPVDPPRLRYSYFDQGVHEDQDGLDYYGGGDYGARPNYWFPHKLSDILSAALGRGFELTQFEERPEDISNTFPELGEAALRPPMSFTMLLRKRA